MRSLARISKRSSPASSSHGIRRPGSSAGFQHHHHGGRKKLAVPQLIEAIQAAHGEVELSLSPVTVAELVHGIYRARTPEAAQRRRAYVEELVALLPVHPATKQTAFLVGQIQGEEAAKGNVLPFNDLMIAAAAIEQGYAILTENVRHFEKIPGIQTLKL